MISQQLSATYGTLMRQKALQTENLWYLVQYQVVGRQGGTIHYCYGYARIMRGVPSTIDVRRPLPVLPASWLQHHSIPPPPAGAVTRTCMHTHTRNSAMTPANKRTVAAAHWVTHACRRCLLCPLLLLLALCPLRVATKVQETTLNNGVVVASFDRHRGLTGIADSSTPSGVVPLNLTVAGDAWAVRLIPRHSVAPLLLSPSRCNWTSGSVDALAQVAVLVWNCPLAAPPREEPVSLIVSAAYAVTPGAAFVAKKVTVASSRPESGMYGSFLVQHVDVWANVTLVAAGSTAEVIVQGNAFNDGLSVAAFVRYPAMGRGVFLSVQNPWVTFGYTQSVGPDGCVKGINSRNADLPGMPLQNLTRAAQCRDVCQSQLACGGFVFQAAECEGGRYPVGCGSSRRYIPPYAAVFATTTGPKFVCRSRHATLSRGL